MFGTDNLLKNGSFEKVDNNGKPIGWSITQGARIALDTADGKNAVECNEVVSQWGVFPAGMFENCAAGAGRSNLGMMRFFFRINRSDNQGTLDVLNMHEGFTYLHPSRSAGGVATSATIAGGSTSTRFPYNIKRLPDMEGSLSIAKYLRICTSDTQCRLSAYVALYKSI